MIEVKILHIDDKRFYVPIKIMSKQECAKCGHIIESDLDDDYLSYPDFDKPVEVHFYCKYCDYDWYEKRNIDLIFRVNDA